MRATAKLLLPAVLLAAGLKADTPWPDALKAGWHGKAVCTLLQQDQAYRLLRCTFPPGVGHDRHYHPAHIGYALEGGTMRITDAKGTRDQILTAGSSYTSAGTAWHEVVNVGSSPVTYLIFEQTGSHPVSVPIPKLK